jgi:8-oxo-dGTP pyrophosphatase MutT (NUDIX family)
LELLMLRRGEEAAFMPGVWVFAGGVVDRADFEAAATPPAGIDVDEWAHRLCGAREVGEEAGLSIGPEALAPWSRWVTPEPVPARFDTRFYVALAPAHAKAEPDGTEMDEARWFGPAEALAAGERDEIELSFPTIRHLEELKDHADADSVLRATEGRVVEAILPRVIGTREAFRVVLPGEPGYDA